MLHELRGQVQPVDEADEPPVAAAAPVLCAPRPFNADPVAALLVSLLLRPVGCIRSRGINEVLIFINLPATIGPMIKARNMMNMKK